MTKRAVDTTVVQRPRSIPAAPLKVEIDLTATGAAWKKQEPRARALAIQAVGAARLDITQAAAIAMAGAENVLGQRDRLVALFVNPELALIERLHEVALAAQHADLMHRAAQDEEAPYADILPRMNDLRSLFLGDMDLVRRRQPKLLPAKVIEEIRAGNNDVRDKANDLNDAANWYGTHWSEIARTSISQEEIKEAGELAIKALARLGAVIVARTPKAGDLPTGELRRRGFALLDHDYNVVRRYGAFLFWDMAGGWEQFVPSLWAGRVGVAETTVGEVPATVPADPKKPA